VSQALRMSYTTSTLKFANNIKCALKSSVATPLATVFEVRSCRSCCCRCYHKCGRLSSSPLSSWRCSRCGSRSRGPGTGDVAVVGVVVVMSLLSVWLGCDDVTVASLLTGAATTVLQASTEAWVIAGKGPAGGEAAFFAYDFSTAVTPADWEALLLSAVKSNGAAGGRCAGACGTALMRHGCGRCRSRFYLP
jgi:hypothetical protein